MKILVKNHLAEPIQTFPGDRVRIKHRRGGGAWREVAVIEITEPTTYNTVFIAQLEPGEAGFERGLVGGIAQEV